MKFYIDSTDNDSVFADAVCHDYDDFSLIWCRDQKSITFTHIKLQKASQISSTNEIKWKQSIKKVASIY